MPYEYHTNLFNCFTPPDNVGDNCCCYFLTVGAPSFCFSTLLPGFPLFWMLHQDRSNFIRPKSGQYDGGQIKSCCYIPCYTDRRCNDGEGYCSCCLHWVVMMPIMGGAGSGIAWVPLLNMAFAGLHAKKLEGEISWSAFFKTTFCPPCFIAQMMREHYARGSAHWSPMMAGSNYASPRVPTHAQLVQTSIQNFSSNDLHFMARRVCWVLRKKGSKKERTDAAFEIWQIHRSVCEFIPPLERNCQQILDAAEASVSVCATCTYHCKMC